MTNFGIFLRGMLMGAADIVPGVSGGTVAFITGIYGRLLGSIKSVDLDTVRQLLRGEFKAAWQRVDGTFLAALAAGILASVLTLARLLSWMLEEHPLSLWAFFFGLILASAVVLLRQVQHWTAATVLALVVGAGVALAVALSPVTDMPITALTIFGSGFLAICAMILPGISGSFILVLLGMYGAVLGAVKSLDIGFLMLLGTGAVCGLLCFSRFLHWLLARYQAPTMAVLTGFLFGSLAVVWPWKHVLAWVEGSHGQLKPAQLVPVLPGDYQVLSGQPPLLYSSLALMVLGFVVVWVIDTRFGGERIQL